MQITSRANRRGSWATVAVGGGIGWPYDIIGFVGGLAYVGAVIFFRARG